MTELETVVEDLKYKIEELEVKNEALRENERKQSSNLELLAKENLELQQGKLTGDGDNDSDKGDIFTPDFKGILNFYFNQLYDS